MTAAAATTPRPVLYLVPNPHRPARDRPGRSAPPHARTAVALPVLAAELAARVLGTLFAPVAARVARGLAEQVPLLARRGHPEPWAAAIAFLLAEEGRLFDYDRCTTRTSFARELDTTLPTLKRRAETIRAALHPLHLELPDPELE